MTPSLRPRAELSRDQQWITWREVADSVAQQLTARSMNAPVLPGNAAPFNPALPVHAQPFLASQSFPGGS